MDQLRPYLDLTEKMGSLMGQLAKGVHDITITYEGDMVNLATRPLTHALLKGLLGAFTDKPVNFVSAPSIAKEKGISVKEVTTQKKANFSGVIRLKLENVEEGPDEIWGTIFAEKHPRIIRLGKIYLDAIPEGSMIVIQNIDRPGVIGNLGTTLGRHNINIGRFQLGRLEDRALCMINIDSRARESGDAEELRALPISFGPAGAPGLRVSAKDNATSCLFFGPSWRIAAGTYPYLDLFLVTLNRRPALAM
ncbi:MAG: hypothetical protein U5J82_07260 [Desulfobacterales bacterium]|nr:hypothetical protein [Desulfobacterales bacterium]